MPDSEEKLGLWLGAVSRSMRAIKFSVRHADERMALLSKRQLGYVHELADELGDLPLMHSNFDVFETTHTPEKLEKIYRLAEQLERSTR
jgi:hypothetical protein